MIKKFIQTGFLLLIYSFIAVAMASPVAMVTDKQGKVSTAGNDVALFSELEAGSQLELSSQSKLIPRLRRK